MFSIDLRYDPLGRDLVGMAVSLLSALHMNKAFLIRQVGTIDTMLALTVFT